ncbi:hypothetical protein GYMLUDRAFT_75329 [Collybiopsis luxurians FD-317 M1]|uniref:CRA domain-containing protein n=1 Tax=Collybiopsis luxurians FD-317 M1 TaxID=944289 RepID=A0A0D0BR69_9AGAR|nr:hypothetical protein GYMLUDRAFT_75329 [Collybiopsis luxurians FD-317 M1]
MSSPDRLQATPIQLRSLILNYLAHNGFTSTARAFMSDSAVRQIDPDGDEIMQASGLCSSSSDSLESTLKLAELRKQIRLEILCGRIDEATALLNKYFPDVLSLSTTLRFEETLVPSSSMDYLAPNSVYPSHLALNLRIQSFIEACRTRPLICPFDSNNATSSPSSFPQVLDATDQQTALLNSAQKLYALAKMLPSEQDTARYSQELESVLGLLAYRVPEDSPISEYLSQDRREAVADQIDYAILYHAKRPVISYLELYARYTSTIWECLNKLRVKPYPGIPDLRPTDTTMTQAKGKQETPDICPPFDLQSFVNGS